MKKLISILVAIAVCLTFTTIAFAEETTDGLEQVVNDIVDAAGEGDLAGVSSAISANADELYAAFGDILDSTNTVKASDAVDYVSNAIADLTGADMSNVKATIEDTLAEYDLSNAEMIASDEVAGFVDKILERLESLGIDTTPIIDTLQNSKLGNAVIGIYTGEVTTEPTEDTTEPEETTAEDVVEPETPDSPETGEASAIAAFAVLAVAAAGAFICTRKKANNED